MVVVEGWAGSVQKEDRRARPEDTLVAEADPPRTGLVHKTWRSVRDIAVISDGVE